MTRINTIFDGISSVESGQRLYPLCREMLRSGFSRNSIFFDKIPCIKHRVSVKVHFVPIALFHGKVCFHVKT